MIERNKQESINVCFLCNKDWRISPCIVCNKWQSGELEVKQMSKLDDARNYYNKILNFSNNIGIATLNELRYNYEQAITELQEKHNSLIKKNEQLLQDKLYYIKLLKQEKSENERLLKTKKELEKENKELKNINNKLDNVEKTELLSKIYVLSENNDFYHNKIMACEKLLKYFGVDNANKN